MKSSIQSEKLIPLTLIILAMASFAMLPKAYAVVPTPDGGYPGANTAEGQNALLNITSGEFNAAIGWLSLKNLTTGNFNTAVGAGTLALNMAEENRATGTGALLLNTNGIQNTATGAFALLNNDTGNFNTAVGFQALFSNTEGLSNTAVGVQALQDNINGLNNTATGVNALFRNTSGAVPGLKGNPLPIVGEFFFGGRARLPRAPLPVENPLAAWARPNWCCTTRSRRRECARWLPGRVGSTSASGPAAIRSIKRS